jgi:YD repeat-containing protein
MQLSSRANPKLEKYMKALVAAFLITTSVFGQQMNPSSEGPIYDREGRMIMYQYADGTRESYAYDEGGRMIRFTNRGGGVTTFRYMSDGSVVTVLPDGTTQN